MKERGWVLGAAAILGFLMWFMLKPGSFLSPSASDSSPPNPATMESPASPAVHSGAKKTNTSLPQPSASVDVDFETGSGKEIPGEKLIRFSSGDGYRKFLAIAPPGTILGRIDPLNSLRVKSGAWLTSALAQTGGSVTGNFYVRVPEVPLEVREKGNTLYEAVGKNGLDLIGAGQATDTWGRGVKVALLDTPTEGVEKVDGETAGHGTAMRSLILGKSGAGRGAAPGAELLAFSVLDQTGKGNSFGLAQAIVEAVDQGARVINMSLGSDGDSPVVRDAVAYALARNVVLVAAAGNEAVNRVSYPAAYDGVMAVASVDAAGHHLYFSNRGKSVDVAGPGYAVEADWPGGKKVQVSGTSASTALVSGAVAALLSREPWLGGGQAAELIVKYADATGLPGAAEEVGGGGVNLQRVFDRNQRGLVDVAIGGVVLKEEGSLGRILVGIQNRGTETVNSPILEIAAGRETRKFYFGSLAPGGTAMESLTFDLARARQEGEIRVEVGVTARGDRQSNNDFRSCYFRFSTER